MRSHIVHAFDERCVELVGRIPESALPALQWLSRLSSPIFWVAYVALTVAYVSQTATVTEATLLALATLTFASFVKLFIRRQRPLTLYASTMKVKSYSFPSSHAYASLLGACYISTATSQWLVAVLVMIVALMVGLSRIRIGAHYPSDVIGGWCMALLIFAAISTF